MKIKSAAAVLILAVSILCGCASGRQTGSELPGGSANTGSADEKENSSESGDKTDISDTGFNESDISESDISDSDYPESISNDSNDSNNSNDSSDSIDSDKSGNPGDPGNSPDSDIPDIPVIPDIPDIFRLTDDIFPKEDMITGGLFDDKPDEQTLATYSSLEKNLPYLSDKDASFLAEHYSTTERPDAGDFEWFDKAFASGMDIRTLSENAVPIRNPLLVEGGWKAYMRVKPDEYYQDGWRFLNVNISSIEEDVTVDLDWWYLFNSAGEGFEEIYPDGTCIGTWNEDRSGFHAEEGDGNFTIDNFFQVDDKQYGTGYFEWLSGEKDYVALCRPGGAINPEYAEESRQEEAGSEKQGAEPDYENILTLAKEKSGAPIAELSSVEDDGTIVIHLYETADEGTDEEHTATWDWYTIDPKTLKGVNFLGEEVDLNPGS